MNTLLKLANEKGVTVKIVNEQTRWTISIKPINPYRDTAKFDDIDFEKNVERAITYLSK